MSRSRFETDHAAASLPLVRPHASADDLDPIMAIQEAHPAPAAAVARGAGCPDLALVPAAGAAPAWTACGFMPAVLCAGSLESYGRDARSMTAAPGAGAA